MELVDPIYGSCGVCDVCLSLGVFGVLGIAPPHAPSYVCVNHVLLLSVTLRSFQTTPDLAPAERKSAGTTSLGIA